MWKIVLIEEIGEVIYIVLVFFFICVEGFEYDCEVMFLVIVGVLLMVILVIKNIGVVFFEYNCVLYIYF